MRFTKMHGAGNDYVFVDCFEEPQPDHPQQLAVALSDRHVGIGADGLILILPSPDADAEMRMFNADGSEAEMCGNGIRCVGRLLYDRGRVNRSDLKIKTGRGILDVRLELHDCRVQNVRVEMGLPILSAKEIPTLLPGDPPLDVPFAFAETSVHAASSKRVPPGTIPVTSVSMGNPHCVIFVDELPDEVVLGWGPLIERHPLFPQRTNVEFVQVISPTEFRLRVWERGSGETRACGTGACAAVVAGVLTDRCEREVMCRLPGGKLTVEWPHDDAVFLSGEATEVYRGEWIAEI